jgi:hypothetical protein
LYLANFSTYFQEAIAAMPERIVTTRQGITTRNSNILQEVVSLMLSSSDSQNRFWLVRIDSQNWQSRIFIAVTYNYFVERL